MAVLGVVAALGLGSCSSSDDSGASAPTGSAAATASCQVDDVPEGGALLPTESSRGLTRGAVGILLPGPGRVPASTRRQGPLLVQALARLGLHPRVEHVDADRTAPVPLTRTLIADGVRVIVLGPVGRAAGVRVEKVAGLAGVPVIEYGGVNFGGSAPYLVSTDYEDVGRLQAQLLVGCLKARGLTDPSIILVDGGTDVDENAVQMAIGAHQVLDPMVAAGKVDVQQETVVKGWDLARAAPVFSQALDASHGRVDGVLAGDDDIARVVTDVLRQRGLGGTVVVGQGSGTQGLRRVLTGQQSATVVTDPQLVADSAARLAAALVAGTGPTAGPVPLTTFTDPLLPSRRLQALLVPGRAVTQATLGDAVRSGAVTARALCRGLSSRCSALGVK